MCEDLYDGLGSCNPETMSETEDDSKAAQDKKNGDQDVKNLETAASEAGQQRNDDSSSLTDRSTPRGLAPLAGKVRRGDGSHRQMSTARGLLETQAGDDDPEQSQPTERCETDDGLLIGAGARKHGRTQSRPGVGKRAPLRNDNAKNRPLSVIMEEEKVRESCETSLLKSR